jgi:iron complex transport system substrate-binding protein
MRVVSLLPSATEIVCALGAGKLLAGRSHECDFPPEVAAVPALTAAKINAGAPSGAIDADARALIDAALSIYRVDAEALREAAPDVIFTQTLCAACAVTPADLERALAAWTGARPAVVSLEPVDLAGVFTGMRAVASALGRQGLGEELLAVMVGRFARVVAMVASRASSPRVAAIEWLDPPMSGGHWIPELVALAGGECVLGEPGRPAARIEPRALAQADPDVVALLPCGFDLGRTRAEAGRLLDRVELAALRARRERRVYALDGSAFFNRPGPRLAESAEILAEIIHPGTTRFGHEGRGWARLA